MKIKSLLSEEVASALTQDSLTQIQEAFEKKLDLTVEAALEQQDAEYSEKLLTLIESINKEHANKMSRALSLVDKKNAKQLNKVVSLFEKTAVKEVTELKNEMVKNLSDYLDEFLSESISTEDLAQAVKNKTAYNVLANLREVLAVDSVMMQESVREAVVDGKAQITTLQRENAELKKQFKALYEANEKTNAKLFLESKSTGFPDKKKAYVSRVLGDKPLKFIQENFDYTVRLFDKGEQEKRELLKEDALKNRKVKPDFVPAQKIVNENVNNKETEVNPYVTELSKQFGTRR